VVSCPRGRLLTVAFQQNFWLAAAAAAPVVALANQVTLTDSLGMMEVLKARSANGSSTVQAAAQRGRNAAFGASLVGYLNLCLQVFTLGIALLSLEGSTDLLPPTVIDPILCSGFGIIALTSFFSSRVRIASNVLDAESSRSSTPKT
jgi:hypothetical protein